MIVILKPFIFFEQLVEVSKKAFNLLGKIMAFTVFLGSALVCAFLSFYFFQTAMTNVHPEAPMFLYILFTSGYWFSLYHLAFTKYEGL